MVGPGVAGGTVGCGVAVGPMGDAVGALVGAVVGAGVDAAGRAMCQIAPNSRRLSPFTLPAALSPMNVYRARP